MQESKKEQALSELRSILEKATPANVMTIQRSLPLRIPDVIAERKRLQNEALQQDIKLKKTTLNRLFWLLVGETIIIFMFSAFQGFRFWGFLLEEWSFRILVTATLTQISVMLGIAVKHLFPPPK